MEHVCPSVTADWCCKSAAVNDDEELAQALEEAERRVEIARAPHLRPLLDETAAIEQRLAEGRTRVAKLRLALNRMPTRADTRVWWLMVPLVMLWAPALGRDFEGGVWWMPPLVALGAALTGRIVGRLR